VTASVLIAGAGIGGLAAALALARRGFDVALFEQAERLAEAGAGIQLSPNATRILLALGLGERLAPVVVTPEAIHLRAARSGREIVTLPLGAAMLARYGAPYWTVHRADLQEALRDAVRDEPRIALTLGTQVRNFAISDDGVDVKLRRGAPDKYRAAVLIGADGLRSRLRAHLGDPSAPRFAGRAAWRATVHSDSLPAIARSAAVNLWIGPGGHLVCYPVSGGAAVNIVAIAADSQQSAGWGMEASCDQVLARFPAGVWTADVRALLAVPERWQKWSLYDRPPLAQWGRGPVTLLGDAAHPMLPYLAQGAAMAIEDAAVLADALGQSPTDPAAALRRYEAARQPRTARVQRAARRNDLGYHLGEPAAAIRNAVLRALGGPRLLAQYDWVYRWRAPAPPSDAGA